MTDPEFTYFGTKKGGEITLPGKKIRKEIAAGLPDGPIVVTFKRARKRRSLDQNNYYWGCVVPAFLASFRDWSPETGWNADMVHEVLKAKFLGKVREWPMTITPDGEVIDVIPTTTKLTTSEFSDYTELARQWAASLDILIADPGEQMAMFEPTETQGVV